MKLCTSILIIISVFTFALAGYKLFQSLSHPLKYNNEIEMYANEFNLSPELIASVINVESSFNEKAKSNKSAIGLMQVKLSTANYLNDLNRKTEISEEQLFEPKTNIYYGSMYLKYLIKKFNNINTALAAYNAGETRVRSWLNSGIYSVDGKTLMYIPFNETRNYVKKVNENMNFYTKIL